MDNAPRYQPVDRVASIAIAIEQPLILLLENGPEYSVLHATRASSEPDDGSITLEDCHQVRITSADRAVIRAFDSVTIIREPKHLFWMASPDGFGSVFSQPSEDPYIVLELNRSDDRSLQRAIKERDFDSFFDSTRGLFSRLPRFYSPSSTELRAPDNYATGRKYFPEVGRFL